MTCYARVMFLLRNVHDRFNEWRIGTRGLNQWNLGSTELNLSHEVNTNADFVAICEAQKSHTTITKLKLSASSVSYIPPDIGQFKHLVHLDFSGNKIKYLSTSLVELQRLRILNLSSNEIESVPPVLFYITTLTHLNLENNMIEILPEGLLHLENLVSLRCDGNKILSPPMSICTLGVQSIFQFLKDRLTRTDKWEKWKPYYSTKSTKVKLLSEMCVEIILDSKIDFQAASHIPPVIKKYLCQASTINNTLLPVLKKCSVCQSYFSKEHLFLNHVCKLPSLSQNSGNRA